MVKSVNLYARIEPEVKEQAEVVFNALGIPASNAITMFYRQIILQKGLPVDVKLPEHPLDVSRMTVAQLDAELGEGYANTQAGHTILAKEVLRGIYEYIAFEFVLAQKDGKNFPHFPLVVSPHLCYNYIDNDEDTPRIVYRGILAMD